MDTANRIVNNRGTIMTKAFLKIPAKNYVDCFKTVRVLKGIASVTNFDMLASWPDQSNDGIYDLAGFGTNLQKKTDHDLDSWLIDLNMGDYVYCLDFDSGYLYENLEFVSRAMSTEATRFYLNGVYFTGDLIVATDGHRLHSANIGAVELPNKIVPSGAIKTLLAVMKELKIHKKSANITVTFFERGVIFALPGLVEIRSKLIDATYPDFKRVIPDHKNSFEGFSVLEIKAAYEAIKVLMKQECSRNPVIKFTAKGKAVFAKTDLAVKHGFKADIGFNCQYLAETGLTGNVWFDSPRDPIKIEDHNKLAVIMPLCV